MNTSLMSNRATLKIQHNSVIQHKFRVAEEGILSVVLLISLELITGIRKFQESKESIILPKMLSLMAKTVNASLDVT